MDTLITNARVLTSDSSVKDGAISLRNGLIETVSTGPVQSAGMQYDAGGQLLLPGMIDLHGDAFERQLLPRPDAPFPMKLALLENDRQLLSNGITTAYYGVTYSWEPGLRGRDWVIELLTTIEAMKQNLKCDSRVHMRWEVFNLAAAEEVECWLEDGRIDLLAFNDHMASILDEAENPAKLARYLQRSGMAREEYMDLLQSLESRASEVPGAIDQMAEVARNAGVIMASHDDDTPEVRQRFSDIGCTLAEFPLDDQTADLSLELGDPIILGSPNVVRGGSHRKRLGAATAVAEGRCDILTSDYYYPAMLQSVFDLVKRGDADFAKAWSLVASNPAKAMGLSDRGSIEPGLRADFVVVDDSDPGLPKVSATFVQGECVFNRSLAARQNIEVQATAA